VGGDVFCHSLKAPCGKVEVDNFGFNLFASFGGILDI